MGDILGKKGRRRENKKLKNDTTSTREQFVSLLTINNINSEGHIFKYLSPSLYVVSQVNFIFILVNEFFLLKIINLFRILLYIVKVQLNYNCHVYAYMR